MEKTLSPARGNVKAAEPDARGRARDSLARDCLSVVYDDRRMVDSDGRPSGDEDGSPSEGDALRLLRIDDGGGGSSSHGSHSSMMACTLTTVQLGLELS